MRRKKEGYLGTKGANWIIDFKNVPSLIKKNKIISYRNGNLVNIYI